MNGHVEINGFEANSPEGLCFGPAGLSNVEHKIIIILIRSLDAK